jgi:ribose transport system permease protein
VNGVLVGVVGLNPLVVTLAIGQIVLGITISYATGIANESEVPTDLSDWAGHRALGVSWIFWVGVLVTIGLALFLRASRVGRRFQAVGANPRAAWVAGVHVRSYVVFAYVGAAVLYGAAGILLAAFIRSPSLDLGDPYLLGPIAAVVIGGASLFGGSGTIIGTVIGALIIAVIQYGLVFINVEPFWQFVAVGIVIIVSVLIDQSQARLAGGGRAEEG